MREDKVKLVNTKSEWRAIPDLPIKTQTVKQKLSWNDKIRLDYKKCCCTG